MVGGSLSGDPHILPCSFPNWMRISFLRPFFCCLSHSVPLVSGSQFPEGIKSSPHQRKVCLTGASMASRSVSLWVRPTKRLCGSTRFKNFLMTIGATAPSLLRGPVIRLNSNHLKSFTTVFQSFAPELFTGRTRKLNGAGGRRRPWPFCSCVVAAAALEELDRGS